MNARLTAQLAVLFSSQLVVLLTGIVTFAVLSRIIGPVPFAQFAVVSFLFTAAVIVFDLSAMGWIVTGLGVDRSTVARRSVFLSSALSCALLCIVFYTANSHLPGGPISSIYLILLCVAVVVQLGQQISRARLVLKARYRRVAVADASAALIASAIAILVAYMQLDPQILVLQLVLGIYIKGLMLWLYAYGLEKDDRQKDPRVRAALYFGVANIPLNSAAYAARAIDSAMMPFVVPIGVAASYARAYQIAVAPAVQAQVSLAPFGVKEIAARRADRRSTKGVWFGGLALSTAAAVVIIVLSPWLERLLFGDQWTDPSLYLTIMAFSLPTTTQASVATWYRQVESRMARSFLHLISAVLTPILCVCFAQAGGVPALILSFVILQGLISPVATSAINADVLPCSWKYRTAAIGASFALIFTFSLLQIDYLDLV